MCLLCDEKLIRFFLQISSLVENVFFYTMFLLVLHGVFKTGDTGGGGGCVGRWGWVGGIRGVVE